LKVHVEPLLACGPFASSSEWAEAQHKLIEAVKAVEWPPNSGRFVLKPVRKKNGVKPIKARFVQRLLEQGFATERPIRLSSNLQPGNLDFMLSTSQGPIAVEWETGNVSSCHRSMNKLALGLVQGVIKGAVMVVPTRATYRYLTDRVANFSELAPYIPFWSAIDCQDGVFQVIVFEHDDLDDSVPLIPQMMDGMARYARPQTP